PALAALRAARRQMWATVPDEMYGLMRRSGMMLPYGPLAMAEGELRKLHELLWRLRSDAFGISLDRRGHVACFLIDAFNARIDGFCALHGCGAVLDDARPLLKDAATASQALEELILYTGRAAAWLDA